MEGAAVASERNVRHQQIDLGSASHRLAGLRKFLKNQVARHSRSGLPLDFADCQMVVGEQSLRGFESLPDQWRDFDLRCGRGNDQIDRSPAFHLLVRRRILAEHDIGIGRRIVTRRCVACLKMRSFERGGSVAQGFATKVRNGHLPGQQQIDQCHQGNDANCDGRNQPGFLFPRGRFLACSAAEWSAGWLSDRLLDLLR